MAFIEGGPTYTIPPSPRFPSYVETRYHISGMINTVGMIITERRRLNRNLKTPLRLVHRQEAYERESVQLEAKIRTDWLPLIDVAKTTFPDGRLKFSVLVNAVVEGEDWIGCVSIPYGTQGEWNESWIYTMPRMFLDEDRQTMLDVGFLRPQDLPHTIDVQTIGEKTFAQFYLADFSAPILRVPESEAQPLSTPTLDPLKVPQLVNPPPLRYNRRTVGAVK